ncbi:MAG: hypothetical protein HW387_905 [Parachlamydiales bacterium]|nr:hypothetical protein [Parachlamydiales bacterium]
MSYNGYIPTREDAIEALKRNYNPPACVMHECLKFLRAIHVPPEKDIERWLENDKRELERALKRAFERGEIV